MRPNVITGTGTRCFTSAANPTSALGSCGVCDRVMPTATPGIGERAHVHRVGAGLDREVDHAQRVVERLATGRNISVAFTRNQIGKSAPTLGAPPPMTSQSSRARFSSEPPQRSSRWFVAGERKSSIR